MKTFLSCWLAAASEIFQREIAGEFDLQPSHRLPEQADAVAFSISFRSHSGCFLVGAGRAALGVLLGSPGGDGRDGKEGETGEIAEDRNAGEAGRSRTDREERENGEGLDSELEVWRSLLRQAAEAAMRLFDPAALPPEVSIEAAAWVPGRPSAAYELRSGEGVVPLAFVDEIERPEPLMEAAKPNSASRSNAAKTTPGDLDLLLDVELETSIRFGSREMSLNEVLDLGAGDVVELDRHVSDPVDLLVGDKIVARGEVVLVNGNFGLRVLEVAEPKKCLESIRCLF